MKAAVTLFLADLENQGNNAVCHFPVAEVAADPVATYGSPWTGHVCIDVEVPSVMMHSSINIYVATVEDPADGPQVKVFVSRETAILWVQEAVRNEPDNELEADDPDAVDGDPTYQLSIAEGKARAYVHRVPLML